MKTILVPTDFSPGSRNAAQYAVDMASAINASIILFHVYTIPVAFSGEVPLVLVSVDDLRKNSEASLEDLKKDMLHYSNGKASVSTETVMGDTIDEIKKICSRVQPFAVVMGTKGTTGLARIIFGSTVLAAIRQLEWPVLCVPPEKKFGQGIKQIGFACDLKDVSSTTPASLIGTITTAFGAALHIVNVDYKDKHFTAATPAESSKLHEMFQELNPFYHYLDNPDVAEGLLQFARTWQLDLIIAIPKKHKFLEGMLKQSSTKQLIALSQVPILCVHE